jgi:hypothetical protein
MSHKEIAGRSVQALLDLLLFKRLFRGDTHSAAGRGSAPGRIAGTYPMSMSEHRQSIDPRTMDFLT